MPKAYALVDYPRPNCSRHPLAKSAQTAQLQGPRDQRFSPKTLKEPSSKFVKMTSRDPSAQLNQSAQGTFKSLLAECSSTKRIRLSLKNKKTTANS
ncbi:unnamed protein product [Prunus armeniaca]